MVAETGSESSAKKQLKHRTPIRLSQGFVPVVADWMGFFDGATKRLGCTRRFVADQRQCIRPINMAKRRSAVPNAMPSQGNSRTHSVRMQPLAYKSHVGKT
ncbi:hypothetical protein V3C99_014983 [Haemonchus contortus]|uniref:Transposase n=1 Tax=Haemonchus contortus TaxID=6289 RepID=A0A7I4YUC7_HAECO